MNAHERVLIVGTTPDYVDWLIRERRQQVVFLTDPELRRAAREPCPEASEELTCGLDDVDVAYREICLHTRKHGLTLVGIACFDCENMLLSAKLAERFGLPHPSPTAILNCRSKRKSKELWQAADVPCPRSCQAFAIGDALTFAAELGPCVAKPLSGAGSELTYRCDSLLQVRSAFDMVKSGLASRSEEAMYNQVEHAGEAVLLEELICGTEYSCDFVVDGDQLEIIRFSRKHALPGGPFGTTAAYELLTNGFPFDEDRFRGLLLAAAKAVGLTRALCMVDLFDDGGTPCFIEIAPRPGGDCLPWLFRKACGVDMLSLFVDFAAGATLAKGTTTSSATVAVRFFAERDGVIQRIITSAVEQDERVLEVYLKRQPGDTIKRPPDDCDLWILGHLIYAPNANASIPDQNRELVSRLMVEWR